jgi:membrane protein
MNSLKGRLEALQHSGAGLFAKKVLEDQTPNLGALIAWGTLSTMLPLLLGMLSLVGLVLRDQQLLDQVYNALGAALPAAAAGPVTQVLDSMRQGSAAPAGVIAIVLLLISGSSFFANMAGVFDQAYHVEGRNMLLERLIALCMLVVTSALLVLSVVAAGFSGVVSKLPGVLPVGPALGQLVGWSMPILSVFVLFVLMYRVLPNVQQTWRSVVPGTVLATALVLVVSQVFPLYVTLFPPNHAYAVFGVFLVLTFWLYILGIVLVLGAELNAFLEQPAEVSGDAPALRSGGLLGAPARSPAEQLAVHAQRPQELDQAHPNRQPQPRASFAGRIVGLGGLVIAALLLRGEVGKSAERRALP